MFIEIEENGVLKKLKVDSLTIFDIKIGGEIGVFPEHESISGIGKYVKYLDMEIHKNFIYFIENQLVQIFFYE